MKNMEGDIFLLIEQYKNGQLSSNVAKEFEQALQNDSEVRLAYTQYELMEQGVEILVKAEVVEDHKQVRLKHHKKRVVRRRILLFTSSAAAVIILLIGFFSNFFVSNENNQTDLSFVEAEFLNRKHINDLLDLSASDSLISLGIRQFQNNDYSVAIQTLENTSPSNKTNYTKAQLIIGLAYMYDGDYEAAVNVLNSIVGDNDLVQSIREKAQWLIIGARLLNGEDQSEELNNIINGINKHSYKSEASLLYNEIYQESNK